MRTTYWMMSTSMQSSLVVVDVVVAAFGLNYDVTMFLMIGALIVDAIR